MKKIMLVVIAILMMATMLTGCGNEVEKNTKFAALEFIGLSKTTYTVNGVEMSEEEYNEWKENPLEQGRSYVNKLFDDAETWIESLGE